MVAQAPTSVQSETFRSACSCCSLLEIGNFLYVCNLQTVTSSLSGFSSCNKKTGVRTFLLTTVVLLTCIARGELSNTFHTILCVIRPCAYFLVTIRYKLGDSSLFNFLRTTDCACLRYLDSGRQWHFLNIRKWTLSENGIGLHKTLMDSHPHDFKGGMSKLVIANRNSYSGEFSSLSTRLPTGEATRLPPHLPT